MSRKPERVERGGEVHADTPDKWSEDDTARQEQGIPNKKGTDTLATTEAEVIEREKGKRTTM